MEKDCYVKLAVAVLVLLFLICDIAGALDVEDPMKPLNEARRLHELGKYREALEKYEIALKIFEQKGQKPGVGACLEWMGRVYRSLHQYEKALEHYKKALEMATGLGDRGLLFSVYYGMSNLFRDTEQYEMASEYHEKASLIAREMKQGGKQKQRQRTLLEEKGVLYNSMGDYRSALICFEKELKIAEESGDRQAVASLTGNIGIAYFGLGQIKRALEKFKRALALAEEMGDKVSQSKLLMNVGGAYSRLGDYADALKSYDRAYQLSIEIDNIETEFHSSANIGYIYLLVKDYRQAIEIFKNSLVHAQVTKDKAIEAALLTNMALAYSGLNDQAKAMEYYGRSLSLSQLIGDKVAEFKNLWNIGVAHRSLKDNAKAIKYLALAVNVLEGMRGEIKLDELQSTFIGQYSQVYEHLIEILIEEGKAEEAFEYAERGKARNFLDSLGNRRILPRNAADRALAERERSLVDEIRSLEVRLRKVKAEEATTIAGSLRDKQKEHGDLIDRLKLSNPEYASCRVVSVSSLKEIQDTLLPREMIIEYYVGDRCIVAWAISKDGLLQKNILIDSTTLRKKIVLVRTLISQKPSPRVPENENSDLWTKYREISRELYSMLLAPFEGEYIGKKTIIIIPHGPLHYVPFSALLDSKGAFVAENYALLTEPSSSAFVLVRKRGGKKALSFLGCSLGSLGVLLEDDSAAQNKKVRRSDSSFVVISGIEHVPDGMRGGFSPLPGTKKEIEAIGKLMESIHMKTSYLTEKNFTRAAVEQSSPGAGYLHLATHGILSGAGKGRYSGLVTSDEFIYVSDVLNWNLDARIAVLSACNTGLGEYSEGDDMVGLSRVFLIAGADTVLASLWSVADDSTTKLMVAFYSNVLKGTDFPEALKSAQKSVMKSYPSPFYWAPFVLHGRGS